MIRLTGLIMLCLALTGCWFRKKKVAVPPTPAPQSAPATVDTPPPVVEPPKSVEQPEPQPPVVDEPKPIEKPSPAPELKNPAANRPQRVPARSAPAQRSPESPPAAVPQLGEILTPETRKRYETEYSGHVARAQQVLARAAGRQLTDPQSETVNRIRTFLRQAEDQRNRDLPTALQLARRADLLGQDLVRTLP